MKSFVRLRKKPPVMCSDRVQVWFGLPVYLSLFPIQSPHFLPITTESGCYIIYVPSLMYAGMRENDVASLPPQPWLLATYADIYYMLEL